MDLCVEASAADRTLLFKAPGCGDSAKEQMSYAGTVSHRPQNGTQMES